MRAGKHVKCVSSVLENHTTCKLIMAAATRPMRLILSLLMPDSSSISIASCWVGSWGLHEEWHAKIQGESADCFLSMPSSLISPESRSAALNPFDIQRNLCYRNGRYCPKARATSLSGLCDLPHDTARGCLGGICVDRSGAADDHHLNGRAYRCLISLTRLCIT
jgi:hypothetical protein